MEYYDQAIVDDKPPIKDVYLAHHGIKGMKWGVRRTPEQLGHKRASHSSPESMNKFMQKEFKYDWSAPKDWVLKSHDEVARTKTGNCHDQTVYVMEELRRMGKNPKARFLIEATGSGQGGMTHSFAYYKEGGKYKWFENAWGDQKGIHTFDTEKDIERYFDRMHSKGEFGDKKKYPKIYWGDFDVDRIRPGENLSGILDYIDWD